MNSETSLPVTLYHNPRCSKSRQTLELLHSRGVQPKVVDYLKTPPGPEEIHILLTRLGLEPREFMRRNEPEYRELGLDDPGLDRAALIEQLAKHPRLIQRPVLVVGERAAIGRPPEAVLALLED